MPNIFAYGSAYQGTSSPVDNPLIYPISRAYQGTSQACIVDLTLPIFSGIVSLSLQPLGQIRATWGTATDASAPIRYEVYIKAGDSINLFYQSNIVVITDKLQFDIFTLPNSVLLSSGVVYYIGVKAVDAVGNRDNNLAFLDIESSGISSSGSLGYEVGGIFTIDENENFIGSVWASINNDIITDVFRLGTASYVIYDKNSDLVAGMSESGIAPDANGQFSITPIASLLDLTDNFYTIKVSIIADSSMRHNYLPISGISEKLGAINYEPRAIFSINASNQLQCSLWMAKDGQQINSGLGTASFTIYDKDGVTTGISQSGLVSDANGVFKMTPVSASSILDLTHYVVLFTVDVDSQPKKGAVGITVAE